MSPAATAPAPPPSEPLAAVRPLTAERFGDVETVFAGKGCSFARSCWCMAYRLSGKVMPPKGTTKAAHLRAELQRLSGEVPSPGLIGYDADEAPVGWVTLGPRESFARLARSPVMKPVDDRPVWSVVCFVVPSPYRGRGIAAALLRHAVDYARQNGAEAVEGYPVDVDRRVAPAFLWHGTRGMFRSAEFAEIARRKENRPVMRLDL
jgi:GNAT superfamily N-acetyltransferase